MARCRSWSATTGALLQLARPDPRTSRSTRPHHPHLPARSGARQVAKAQPGCAGGHHRRRRRGLRPGSATPARTSVKRAPGAAGRLRAEPRSRGAWATDAGPGMMYLGSKSGAIDKDLRIALTALASHHVPAPVSAAAPQLVAAMMAAGEGQDDDRDGAHDVQARGPRTPCYALSRPGNVRASFWKPGKHRRERRDLLVPHQDFRQAPKRSSAGAAPGHDLRAADPAPGPATARTPCRPGPGRP